MGLSAISSHDHPKCVCVKFQSDMLVSSGDIKLHTKLKPIMMLTPGRVL